MPRPNNDALFGKSRKRNDMTMQEMINKREQEIASRPLREILQESEAALKRVNATVELLDRMDKVIDAVIEYHVDGSTKALAMAVEEALSMKKVPGKATERPEWRTGKEEMKRERERRERMED